LGGRCYGATPTDIGCPKRAITQKRVAESLWASSDRLVRPKRCRHEMCLRTTDSWTVGSYIVYIDVLVASSLCIILSSFFMLQLHRT